VIGAVRNEGELGSVTVKNTGSKVRLAARPRGPVA